MEKLTAREIAQAVDGLLYGDAELTSVTTDSRQVKPGALFVALKGEKVDGNEFLKDAVRAGAAAVLCSSGGARDDCAVIKVQNTHKALLQMGAYYKTKFSVKTVAVTGSVGKTTTKEFIYAVLSSCYQTLKTNGNFNNEIGLPLTMLGLSSQDQMAVLEMGMSNFGEIERLSRAARPDIGVITNIGVSHIENLGSRENILKAKLEIRAGMGERGQLVLNGDDPLLWGVRGTTEKKEWYYGINNPQADLRAEKIVSQGDHTEFDILRRGEREHAVIHTVGTHNVYNALAAVQCGLLCGISFPQAVQALTRFKSASNRQNIYETHGIKIIDDCYNASPDSMKAVLQVLAQMEVRGHKIAVLADMLELGDFAETAHRQVGEAVKNGKVDVLFAYGDNARFYVEGAIEAGLDRDRAMLFDDKQELARGLAETAEAGDAVLFKGSRGMKTEEIIDMFLEELGR